MPGSRLLITRPDEYADLLDKVRQSLVVLPARLEFAASAAHCFRGVPPAIAGYLSEVVLDLGHATSRVEACNAPARLEVHASHTAPISVLLSSKLPTVQVIIDACIIDTIVLGHDQVVRNDQCVTVIVCPHAEREPGEATLMTPFNPATPYCDIPTAPDRYTVCRFRPGKSHEPTIETMTPDQFDCI